MLSSEDLQTLTFKAPYIYEHADRPYFIHEVNLVAQRLHECADLGFFIRYRSNKDDASQYKWSRIVKVVNLSELAAEEAEECRGGVSDDSIAAVPKHVSGSGSGPAPRLTINTSTPDVHCTDGRGASAVVNWRSKTFWTSFVVEGESGPVHYPRVSAKMPTEEEVADYCARRMSSARTDSERAALCFIDTGMDAAVLAEPAEAILAPRSYLPTRAQLLKLKLYRQEHISHHQWTPEEIEETRQRNARFSRAGVAAAPVAATLNQVHNMKVETEVGIAGGHPMTAGLRARTLPPQAETLSQASTSAFDPQASAAAAMRMTPMNCSGGSGTDSATSPRSPFLPKRLQQRRGRDGEPLPSSSPSSSHPPPHGGLLLGADSQASLFSSQTPQQPSPTLSQLVGRQGSGTFDHGSAAKGSWWGHGGDEDNAQGRDSPHPLPVISAESIQQWEEVAHREKRFYAYVSDTKRSEYLNKVANITQRNYAENKRTRLRGIDNEKRLERHSNLSESVGLWETNDAARAKKAALYKASMEESGTGAKAPEGGNGGATSAAAAARDGGEKTGDEANAESRRAQSEEDVFVKTFMERRRAQELSFDSIVVDELWSEADVASLSNGNDTETATYASPVSVTPGSPYKLEIRDARKSSALATQSHTLVRSASRMALRHSSPK